MYTPWLMAFRGKIVSLWYVGVCVFAFMQGEGCFATVCVGVCVFIRRLIQYIACVDLFAVCIICASMVCGKTALMENR